VTDASNDLDARVRDLRGPFAHSVDGRDRIVLTHDDERRHPDRGQQGPDIEKVVHLLQRVPGGGGATRAA